MIDYDIGDVGDLVMARYGHDGYREFMLPYGVDGDDSIHPPIEKGFGILLDEIRTMAMTGYKEKVSFFEQTVFYSAEDGGGVAFADLGHNDADGKTPPGA